MTQDSALTILKTGANVFLTGEPGSGKTHTINTYVAYLHSCGIEPAITASTGIAATHVGGMTIHSWCGIGVKSVVTEYDLDAIMQKEKVVRRVTNARVLIIDEISMLSAETLTSVELVCRTIRRSEKPFGGLQVVFVGDFFQLPPIVKRAMQTEVTTAEIHYDEEPASIFAFRSRAWTRANPLVCYLHEQHRQEDATYLEVLSGVRSGKVTPQMREHLTKRAVSPVGKKIVTKLFPHNANVDSLNERELGTLEGTPRSYVMRGKGAPPLIEALKRNCLAPEALFLKVGAKVMFIKNSMEGDYVNGTTGEVVEFSKISTYPVVRTHQGRLIEAEPDEWTVQDGTKVLASISQVPLRLAWAITVHKSQGMSLDSAIIDLSQAFEYGQGYVALSRVRSLSGLYLRGFNERALEVHPEVAEQDTIFRGQSDETEDAFEKLLTKDVETMHDNFIKACGGTMGQGRKVAIKKQVGSTYDATLALVERRCSLPQMQKERGMTLGTIVGHIEKLIEEGRLSSKNIEYLKPARKDFPAIQIAFETVYKKEGAMPLSPVRSLLGDAHTFDELRIARLFVPH